MTTLDIVKSKMDFLIEEYAFNFEFNNIHGSHYIFKNKNGSIEFYEWKQFDEFAIFVNYEGISKQINLIEEYPKIIGQFNQSHKGIKYFFKDERYDFWEMIAKIIAIEISTKKHIFGLKI